MNITIAVGGRFHADRVARALIAHGHNVRVFTTLPRRKFGSVPTRCVHSFLWPEMVFRLSQILGKGDIGDQLKMQSFSTKVARRLERTTPEAFLFWSSFGWEALRKAQGARKILFRESTHILHQMEIISDEFRCLGLSEPQREKCIERELREYEAADLIAVPSNFARLSFLERGFAPEKIKIVPLSVDTTQFLPERHKDWSGRLKILYFGTLSLRKGMHYFFEAAEKLQHHDVDIEVIGPLNAEVAPWLKKFPFVKFHPSMNWNSLSQEIRKYHLFLFPTLEDGFGAVVPQAMASGLVPIVTADCGAAEWIEHGSNGFIIRARETRAIVSAVEAALEKREDLKRLSENAVTTARKNNWAPFESSLIDLLRPEKAKVA